MGNVLISFMIAWADPLDLRFSGKAPSFVRPRKKYL